MYAMLVMPVRLGGLKTSEKLGTRPFVVVEGREWGGRRLEVCVIALKSRGDVDVVSC